MISSKILKMLEFDKVQAKIKNHLVLEMSFEVMAKQSPSQNFDEAKQRLELTAEADRLISSYNIDPIIGFDTVDMILLKCKKDSVLAISEIMKIAGILRSSRLFKNRVGEVQDAKINQLKMMSSNIFIDKKLEDEISRCFVTDEIVSDNASEKLSQIRKKIRKCNEDVKDKLTSIIRSTEYQKYIQDSIVTIRAGRYVVPVKQEYKNQISGMLHDRSDTGATVYIEPAAVVQLNNELRLLQIQEAQEIERILYDFTVKISLISDNLHYNSQILADADIAFAKAKYAHSTKSICPELNSSGMINIINGRHPLIDSAAIVPINVSVGKNYKILIITGPNTGGKTVTLKLCGLFCIMAMSGIFLPSGDGTEVSVFDNIFADIGDEQSIEQSLSTFSSHMTNIINIVNKVDESSLVLLDELGVGTDPAEGAALALSIIEYLTSKTCKGIITTHYSEVKEYAFITENIMNASMEFDPVLLTPTYKLSIGMPGSSNALEISKKLGLNEDIINKAYSYISRDKITFENVLKNAEKARAEAEKNLEVSEKLKDQFEQQLAELEKEKQRIKSLNDSITKNSKIEAKRIYANAAEESQQLLEELQKIIKQSELAEYDIVRAKQIKNALESKRYIEDNGFNDCSEKIKPIDKGSVKQGDVVFVKSLGSEGTVTEVSHGKNQAEVMIGNMTLNVKFDDLYKVIHAFQKNKPKKSRKGNSEKVVVAKHLSKQAMISEVKLLGKNVLEAIPETENFIDACIVSGFKECKIIHGTGTGVLRKAIWEYLKTHPNVDEFRSGKYGEGERGVTIVTLK